MAEPTQLPATKDVPKATQPIAEPPTRTTAHPIIDQLVGFSRPVGKPAQEFRQKRAEEAQKVLKEAQDVLAEYDGLEADIPVSHNYWVLMNEFRYLSKV